MCYIDITMQLKTVLFFKTEKKEPVLEWIESLDNSSRSRIFVRLERLKAGNYGDHKRFKGIVELRFHFGQGYRIYIGEDGKNIVILLAGGDKSTQHKDIYKALTNWEAYNDKNKI